MSENQHSDYDYLNSDQEEEPQDSEEIKIFGKIAKKNREAKLAMEATRIQLPRGKQETGEKDQTPKIQGTTCFCCCFFGQHSIWKHQSAAEH